MSVLSRIRKKLFSSNFNDEFELIRKEYHLTLKKEKIPILVISCIDSRTSVAGFADRLRGMLSCYAYAKAINTPFRIEHISPFDLCNYLVPNQYDWRLRTGEKSMNLLYANPVFFICNEIGYHNRRFFWISRKRQHHLYTNSDYIKDINNHYGKSFCFHELFQELFKPSLSLEKVLDSHKCKLGPEGYVSVSFRFMQLMGDFKDVYGDVLSEAEKRVLLNKSLSVICQLHEKENKKILVTSDSQSFIDEALKLSFVYVAPGKIGHIGFSQGEDVNEKMFVDFLLISQAEHVYMAYSGKMYRSHFAKTAAMSTGVPYDEIQF